MLSRQSYLWHQKSLFTEIRLECVFEIVESIHMDFDGPWKKVVVSKTRTLLSYEWVKVDL